MSESTLQTPSTETPLVDSVSIRVRKYEEGAVKYQERRHPEWRENYSLYRDKVQTNRLVQRQSVNIPMMKETGKTVLAKIDEFPDLHFESLSGDKQKEIFLNEYWEWFFKEDRLEVKDIQDKKQVFLYGRSIMKLNLHADGRPTIEVLEPYDWICDRHADPADIDGTAMYMAHINIYQSLSEIMANPIYDEGKVGELKMHYASAMGQIEADANETAMRARNERMQDMGVTDVTSPELGETYVNIKEHYIKLWDDEEKRLKIYLRIEAGGITILNKPLEDIFGINFYPFVTWADDVEKTDIWSDGIADIVRTPNKVMNAWFSQMIENRTLRNYGMTFYDATISEKFIPQTYEPTPWGWYPVAGDPNKVTKRVDIPDLSESLDELGFVIGMVEKATASTAIEKGAKTAGDTTLGEVKLMLANSSQRIVSIAKFYKIARRELGEKWYNFLMANEQYIEAVELYKKSGSGKYFKETVASTDWKDEAGYACKVSTSAEREEKTIETIQKIQAVKGMFGQNQALDRIAKKKALDMLELTAEEIDEILGEEEQVTQIPPEEIPTIPATIPQAPPVGVVQ
tara:strand:+ start:7464 stop:9179 length:1716 start_codon:yes stop_codon:yes gene_type:complete